MPKVILVVLIGLVGIAAGGCVTTSTGGFSAEASPEDALRDYLRLSAAYLENGDTANARRHLENALNLDPNNSEAYGIWGLVYSREGDLELADESFRRAIRLDAGNSQARNNYAAFLFANARYRDAYQQLRQVVQDTTYSARAQAFENLGVAALRLDLVEEAENAFNRALQLNPNQRRSSLELADLNLAEGDVLQARAYYRNFLVLSQRVQAGQTPRSLWVGIRLEQALGNDGNAQEYAAVLEERFENSLEYQMYLRSLNNDE